MINREVKISDLVYACVLSCFSCVQLCETLLTVACQASLSKGHSKNRDYTINFHVYKPDNILEMDRLSEIQN